MQYVDGYWLPDREEKVHQILKETRQLGRPAYQQSKFAAAMKYCPEPRGLALDVGAHIGMWTLQMLQAGFEQVISFEPDPEKHQCFVNNLRDHGAPSMAQLVTLHRFGLSDEPSRADLVQKTGSSLKTHVRPNEDGAIELRRLDDVPMPEGIPIDFMKIDVEGFEVFVLHGAEGLILREKPVIIIEQKVGVASKRYGRDDHLALHILECWGYKQAEDHNGDFIMLPHRVWDKTRNL